MLVMVPQPYGYEIQLGPNLRFHCHHFNLMVFTFPNQRLLISEIYVWP